MADLFSVLMPVMTGIMGLAKAVYSIAGIDPERELFIAFAWYIERRRNALERSSSAKAANLRLGQLLGGLAWPFAEPAVTSRVPAAILFLVLATPVASHRIARVAYLEGIRFWEGTFLDELKGRYDDERNLAPEAVGKEKPGRQRETEPGLDVSAAPWRPVPRAGRCR